LLQSALVYKRSVLLEVDGLPGSYISVNELRMLVREPQTQYCSPGVAHNEDLFPLEPVTKVVYHLERVLLHLRHVHGFALEFFVIRRVSLTCSPLVPLNYGEIFLPRALKRARQRNKSNAGTAMNEQKDRVVHVLASHFDPLINTADSHRLKAVDAIG